MFSVPVNPSRVSGRGTFKIVTILTFFQKSALFDLNLSSIVMQPLNQLCVEGDLFYTYGKRYLNKEQDFCIK